MTQKREGESDDSPSFVITLRLVQKPLFLPYFLFFTAFTIHSKITEPMTAMIRL